MASCSFSTFLIILVISQWNITTATASLNNENSIKSHTKFEEWINRFNKVYPNISEKAKRFEIFRENLNYIQSHNNNNNLSFVLALNKFSDLSEVEFSSTKKGYKFNPASKGNIVDVNQSFIYEQLSTSDLPSSVDWRIDGAVTGVKNQGGSCGSCWAFATVAVVEGIYKIRRGDLISLSEQELIDCSGIENACGGSGPAYDFVQQNGLTGEDNYPYQGAQLACNYEALASEPRVYITGHTYMPSGNEMMMMQAVSQQPIFIAVDSNCTEFNFYGGGVLTASCGTSTDHVMALIGYGTDENTGENYWIAKNSWGESWGENGYIRMQRDAYPPEGICGLATEPSYPNID